MTVRVEEVHVEGVDVRVATLDRGTANPITLDMADALSASVASIRARSALVITGSGDMFTGGLDTAVLARGGAAADELLAAMGRVLVGALRSPRPIVVAANGHGIAAGAMLMLTSDHAVITDRPARYGFAEVPNGLPLPASVVRLIAAKANPMATLRLAAHGDLAGPGDAVELGLANEVVTATDLMDTALGRAAVLAALPEDAYAQTKASVNGPLIAAMA